MKTFVYALIALVVVGLVGGFFVVLDRAQQTPTQVGDTSDARQVYQSDRYGYSFEVPAEYELKEYTEESVSIGASLPGDGFESVANIRLYQTGEEVGYENYEQFVFETLRNMCAADGPNETIYCESVSARQPFTTTSGLSGDVLYLHRVHENLQTGRTETEEFGPFFVFTITPNVPRASFAALVVEPPAHLPVVAVNDELIRAVAASVQIDTVEQETTERMVLVTEVVTTDAGTEIVVDPVEWLQGDAAVAAVVEDTDCTVENAEECIPSLNNNFYIRNVDETTARYLVDAAATVTLQEAAQPVTRTIGDVDTRVSTQESVLANITLRGDVVVAIEEIYMP